jgi:hypothetical protein
LAIRRCVIIDVYASKREVLVVRCIWCGHLAEWCSTPIVGCPNCQKPMIMPDEQTARVNGVFAGVTPEYLWFLRQDEVIVLMDGLESLMEGYKEALQQGNMNQDMFNALTGSYTYVKMTRMKFLELAPDVREQIESA